jgi:hypothetical protein
MVIWQCERRAKRKTFWGTLQGAKQLTHAAAAAPSAACTQLETTILPLENLAYPPQNVVQGSIFAIQAPENGPPNTPDQQET